MDPITVIVTAVALGASTGLKDTAAAAVKDAYAALKALLTRRKVDVAPVERLPASEAKQDSLREDLTALDGTPDAVDDQLLAAARALIAAVEDHQPDAGAAIGIDVERLHASSLRVNRVAATGTGFRAREVDIGGDAVFEDIRAGGGPASGGADGPAGPPA